MYVCMYIYIDMCIQTHTHTHTHACTLYNLLHKHMEHAVFGSICAGGVPQVRWGG